MIGRSTAIRGLRYIERRARAMRLRFQAAERSNGADTRTGGGAHSKPNDSDAWEAIYSTDPKPVHSLESPIARAIEALSQPGDVLLEAGCGGATVSAELATAGRRIELADFSKGLLEQARRLFEISKLPAPGLTHVDLTKQPFPWADGAVDITWSSGVLEHWTDEELLPIVREMVRISRKAVISMVPYAGCVLYRLGKHLSERAGVWPYGREMPRHTQRGVFEQCGLSGVQENLLLPEWAPNFLGTTDPAVAVETQQWWGSLADDDPVKRSQGALLLTVGYCR